MMPGVDAVVAFYESLGARMMDEWTVMRVDDAALQHLGAVRRN
jgi:hypothetical protein